MSYSEGVELLVKATVYPTDLAIITPVFNAEKYVEEMLESVLSQEGVKLEVIIVDDGSTDQSLERVLAWAKRDNRITVAALESNCGAATARNLAVSLTKSRWLCPFDADDIMHAGALLPYFEYVTQRESISWGYCGLRIEDTQTGSQLQMLNHYDFIGMLERNVVCHGMCLIKKTLFDEVHGYNETLHSREDYDLFLRMMEYTDPVFYSRALYSYRRHSHNLSHDVLRTDNSKEGGGRLAPPAIISASAETAVTFSIAYNGNISHMIVFIPNISLFS